MKKRKVFVLDFCAPKVAHLDGDFEVKVSVPRKYIVAGVVKTAQKHATVFTKIRPVIGTWITVGVW